jgi:hypothetical protein
MKYAAEIGLGAMILPHVWVAIDWVWIRDSIC